MATPTPPSADPMSTRSPLPILAIGDSLTEGYAGKWTTTPYTAVLESHFKGSPPVLNYGCSGETTTQIKARFDQIVPDLQEDAVTGHSLSVVILLGGSNDLGSRRQAAVKTICDNLQSMITTSLAICHGMMVGSTKPLLKVLVMTIPVCGGDKYCPFVKEMRDTVNGWIRGLPEQFPNLRVLDLESEMPQIRDTENLWLGDKLHFSSAGYQRMGELVLNSLTCSTTQQQQ